MKRINLTQLEHSTQIGDVCGHISPNITEDSIFYSEDEPIGFYIKDISKYSQKASKLASLANKELRSNNVPKSVMKRSSGFANPENEVLQYSTIIGSVPPKPHMRRPYATISSVHNVSSANVFIKSMLLLCKESEELIKKITPNVYEAQLKLIEKNVPEKGRFGQTVYKSYFKL